MPEVLIPEKEQEANSFSWSDQETNREIDDTEVDFSKCQIDKVLAAHDANQPVEYESFSPYLRDNDPNNASMNNELNPEDKTGIEILKLLNQELPKAQAISLYDEYNIAPDQSTPFDDQQKKKFLNSIKQRLSSEGANIDHFVSESSKVEAANQLIDKLRNTTRPDGKPIIKEKGNGAIYYNDGQGKGDDHFFPLRTKGGHWMCEALDASSFLDEKNREITHLVVLPERFKIQQDRVFNVLNTLGIQPENYHNIFFNPDTDPQQVVQKIKEQIDQAKVA